MTKFLTEKQVIDLIRKECERMTQTSYGAKHKVPGPTINCLVTGRWGISKELADRLGYDIYYKKRKGEKEAPKPEVWKMIE